MGTATSSRFMLGDGELMVGLSSQALDLNLDDSIGLTKNISIAMGRDNLNLPSGPRAITSRTTNRNAGITIRCDLYEMRTKVFGLLTGTASLTDPERGEVAITTSEVDINTTTVSLAVADEVSIGDYVSLFHDGRYSQPRRVVNKVGLAVTVDYKFALVAPVGSQLKVVNHYALEAAKTDILLSARVSGFLADQSPIDAVFPKLSIASPMELLFASSDYSSIPLEFNCLPSEPGDANFAYFGNSRGAVRFMTPRESTDGQRIGIAAWDQDTAWDNSFLWI